MSRKFCADWHDDSLLGSCNFVSPTHLWQTSFICECFDTIIIYSTLLQYVITDSEVFTSMTTSDIAGNILTRTVSHIAPAPREDAKLDGRTSLSCRVEDALWCIRIIFQLFHWICYHHLASNCRTILSYNIHPTPRRDRYRLWDCCVQFNLLTVVQCFDSVGEVLKFNEFYEV